VKNGKLISLNSFNMRLKMRLNLSFKMRFFEKFQTDYFSTIVIPLCY